MKTAIHRPVLWSKLPRVLLRLVRSPQAITALLGCCLVTITEAATLQPAARAATARAFDVPAGVAIDTLKTFSEQAGVAVVFATDSTTRAKTNAVKGTYTVAEAVALLLHNRGLTAIASEKTGTLTITRDPNAPRSSAVPGATTDTVVPPPAARTAEKEAVVELQAFEVKADGSDSYEALNTSGVTGTNRSIRSLPITMNAFTRTFIDELGATDISDLLKFTPNVSYSFDSTGGGNQSPEQFRLRGLTSKEERRRNGFVSLSRGDTFSMERLEVLRGAQALLYGQGVSSGAVNTVTKRATKGRFGEVRAQLDSVRTRRFTFDYNDTLGATSLRVAALTGHTGHWQDNLGDEPRGFYLEAMHRLSRTFTVRANHEYITEDSRTRINIPVTIRDTSLRDPRVGRTLDELIYTGGDLTGITLGGKPVSRETYRSPQSIEGGRRQIANTTTVSIEGSPLPRLSTRLAWNYQSVHIFGPTNNNVADLSAPTDVNAVDGQWSWRINPLRNRNYWHIWSVQGAAVYQHDLGQILKNQFVVGGENRLKQQTFTAQRLFQVDAAGNWVPGSDVLGRRQLLAYSVPIQSSYPNRLSPPAGYQWGENAAFNSVPATPANPHGLSGTGNFTLRVERQLAGYVNWLGSWFNERAETMLGVRLDRVTLDNDQVDLRITNTTAKSGLAGIVFNFTPDFGIYANASKSFAAAGTFQPSVDNVFPQPGEGLSYEAGMKFDLWGRISGSLAFYDNRAENEALALPAAARNIVDGAGINGRNGGTGATANVRSRGAELVLSAQPAKGWRIYLSAGTNDATITTGLSHQVFYNDQFNVANGRVQVKQPDGTFTDLLVPSTRTIATSPRVPLQVQWLTDNTGGYRATLDPVSGRITNAAALFLTTAGVGTGVTGLPITRHQLGFVAPNNGDYTIFAPGDKTTPNSGFTFSANSNYTLQSGPLKNASVGGTVIWQREIRQGYVTVGGERRLYFQPEFARLDARFGYPVKLRGATLHLQFTVQNVFSVQPLERTRNDNGTLALINFSQPPRFYQLTSTLRF
jgi:outer membrane receptor protein involved in Fe transport